MAVLRQVLERGGHVAQGFGLAFQFLHMLQRDALDVALARLRSRHSASSSFICSTENPRSRAAHETQRVQLVVAVDAVSRLGAQRRADQSDAFVVADHLGGNARGLGGLSDVHHVGSCVVRRRAQARAACGRKVFRRSALPSTKTLDSAMAPAAKIGDSDRPKAGYSAPAASGISAAL